MESLEEKYLEAIRALKSELRQLLEPEEAERLNRRLGQYLRWARSPAHPGARPHPCPGGHPRASPGPGSLWGDPERGPGPGGCGSAGTKTPFPTFFIRRAIPSSIGARI